MRTTATFAVMFLLIGAALFLLDALGWRPINMLLVGLFCVAVGLAAGLWGVKQ